jgi:hypothetical protein
MRNRYKGLILATAVLFAFSPGLRAQTAPAGRPGKMAGKSSKAKMTSEKKFNPRDLSGVWDSSLSFRENKAYIGTFPDKPAMTPWAQALFDKAKPTFGPRSVPVSLTNDPVYQCFPPGTPRIFFHPFPVDIVQVPGRVIMLFEYDHMIRQIFLTGQHPDNMLPSYMGDSIGHWDGDTLVVDTVGFNGKTWVDREGHPSSTDLHVIERIRRINYNTLQDHITVIDPKAYTMPWGGNFLFRLHPTWRIGDFVCEDGKQFLKFEKEELTPQEKKMETEKKGK